MIKFRAMIQDKRRLGTMALAAYLLLGFVGLFQGSAGHFVRGIFLGIALTLMISDLYQKERRRRLSL